MTSVATSPSASKPCSTIGTLLTRQSLAFFAVVFFVVTTVPHLPDEPLTDQRAPMGQAVIGGVITSSLLTLVVVPVVYCYMDDLARWARRRFGAGASAQH